MCTFALEPHHPHLLPTHLAALHADSEPSLHFILWPDHSFKLHGKPRYQLPLQLHNLESTVFVHTAVPSWLHILGANGLPLSQTDDRAVNLVRAVHSALLGVLEYLRIFLLLRQWREISLALQLP
jgi:hypothetical protein